MSGRRAILTYHSIDDSGSPISVSPSVFESHVTWLGSGRVRVVALDDLCDLKDDGDAIAVTFDDAVDNFGSIAAPLLVDNGIPATLFVVSEHVGRTNEWGGHSA